jgi:hypothetical protein
LANGANAFNISSMILLADFYFEGRKSFSFKFSGTHADGLRSKIHSQSTDEIDLSTVRSAKKATQRQPIESTQCVIKRHLDGSLCDRVTLASTMKFQQDRSGLFEIHLDQRGRKILLRHDLHRF